MEFRKNSIKNMRVKICYTFAVNASLSVFSWSENCIEREIQTDWYWVFHRHGYRHKGMSFSISAPDREFECVSTTETEMEERVNFPLESFAQKIKMVAKAKAVTSSHDLLFLPLLAWCKILSPSTNCYLTTHHNVNEHSFQLLLFSKKAFLHKIHKKLLD